MSDISINLDGLVALLVFLLASAGLAVGGIVSLVIAFVLASKRDGPVRKQNAFAYFLASAPLLILNLAAFGILLFFVDSNPDEFNKLADRIVLYAWLPLQPVIWILAGMFLNKLK